MGIVGARRRYTAGMGRPMPPETRAKIAEGMRRAWAEKRHKWVPSQETRERWAAAMRRRWAEGELVPPSEATRAKIGADSRARWNDPEQRAKMVAGLKRRWATDPPPQPMRLLTPEQEAARIARMRFGRRATDAAKRDAEGPAFAAWIAERASLGPVSGAPRERRPWCTAEDAWLLEHRDATPQALAAMLGRTVDAVKGRRKRLLREERLAREAGSQSC